MVSFLILLRPLRVYILKQLFPQAQLILFNNIKHNRNIIIIVIVLYVDNRLAN